MNGEDFEAVAKEVLAQPTCLFEQVKKLLK